MGIISESVKVVGGVVNDEMSAAGEANAQARKQAKAAKEQNLAQMRTAAEREAFSRSHSDVVHQAQETMHNGAQNMNASELVVSQQPEWNGVDSVGYSDGLEMG